MRIDITSNRFLASNLDAFRESKIKLKWYAVSVVRQFIDGNF